MYSSPSRLSRVQHLGTAAVSVGIVGGVAVTALGALKYAEPRGIWLIIVGGAMICVSVVAQVLIRLALKVESHTARLHSQVFELSDVLEKLAKALDKVQENTSISEAAKSIAHRDQERDALRGAIYEEVRREDFDAAFHLIDDLETRLGQREEAEKLRVEIRDACTEAFKAKLKQVIVHVHSLLEKHRWPEARAEIERLDKVMPNDPRVTELWKVLDQKREAYKHQMIADWREGVVNNNIERCLDILKELDPYLSRAEARLLESEARDLYKERLQQLGVQFQFAVREHRWQDALATGLQITEEFPNSRMAKEVQEHLAQLRTRAGIPTDFEVTSRPE